MARAVPFELKHPSQKAFVKIFNEACQRHNRWTVWSDFVVMAAISISNTVDKSHAGERENIYTTLAGKYNKNELDCFCRMFTEFVTGVDVCPDQDYLGEIFMSLGLGNDHNGQFFTPYHVCHLMSEITYDDTLISELEAKGWVSVNDCACGAGALLIAFANVCQQKGINYQTSVLFVAQDIDYIVGCMCYLQLSIMGCAGYVVIGDSLLNPSTSIDRRGLIPRQEQNVWYTPFYFRDVWHWRRQFYYVSQLFTSADGEPEPKELPEPEPEERAPDLVETKAGQLSFF